MITSMTLYQILDTIPPLEPYVLTAYVHEKTNENAFFVSARDFIKDSRRWKWDATTFGAKGKDMHEYVKLSLCLMFTM